jgi:transcriptional regulator with XRE-family HTH domain
MVTELPALALCTTKMATTLAPVGSREVVRCDLCLLIQFRNQGNTCRRCKVSLDSAPAPEPCATPEPAHHHHMRPSAQLAATAKRLRLDRGLSQRDLGSMMRVPRTYISKIENENATPTLSSLERLARALEVTVAELLTGGEKGRQDEIGELVKDQFISELVPFVRSLNRGQMSSVLVQAQHLASRSRARAAVA